MCRAADGWNERRAAGRWNECRTAGRWNGSRRQTGDGEYRQIVSDSERIRR
ncbi:MAG: hypothetical protein NC254_13945 [bacterium]|nr:hypothetical protein [bacterium]